ncbi:carbon-nitrogen hydrolase [Diplocarpon rosae]|nr:carbon-nitrogen hydrolase [Diplocarpon rosae]
MSAIRANILASPNLLTHATWATLNMRLEQIEPQKGVKIPYQFFLSTLYLSSAHLRGTRLALGVGTLHLGH